jgi:2-polyprenyl-6-methoxyphenol hydroxylase-like FAD-dependent oxidoreductase
VVSAEALRVAVIGAGPAGLCLAQGLRAAGVDVTVHERDAGFSVRNQGYRVHLDARAGLALRACLDEDAFELFLASVGQPGRAVTVLDRRLRVIRRMAGGVGRASEGLDPATMSVSVDRRTLREVLAYGLGEVLRFGHALASSQLTGPVSDGDVGDGVNSVVRRQFLPDVRVPDTGTRCIYGRTPLSALDQVELPDCFADSFTAVTAGRLGLACGMHRYRTPFEELAARWPGALLSPQPDYLMWALAGRARDLPVADEALRELDATGLHRLVAGAVSGWHPTIRQVIEHAAVEDTQLIRVQAAVVPTAPWPPGRVTVLGDAIHAMSPARGSGANTALADAARLAAALTAAATPGDRARTGLWERIGRSEADLRRLGDEAVTASRLAETRFGPPPRWLRLLSRQQRV